MEEKLGYIERLQKLPWTSIMTMDNVQKSIQSSLGRQVVTIGDIFNTTSVN